MSTVDFRADPPTQDPRNMVQIAASSNLGYSNMVHVAGSTVHSGRACGRLNRMNRVNRVTRTRGSQHRAPAWRRPGDTYPSDGPTPPRLKPKVRNPPTRIILI